MTKEDIINYCAENLAGYKKPKYVEFIEAQDMPRVPSGKILKKELRRRYS